jgi:hypothetical protein
VLPEPDQGRAEAILAETAKTSSEASAQSARR